MLQPYNALCHGFLREDNAKTTPILRFAQEQALRVKLMLEPTYFKLNLQKQMGS